MELYKATFPVWMTEAKNVDFVHILPYADGLEPAGYWLILGPELMLREPTPLSRADFLSSEGIIHRVSWADVRAFAESIHQSIDAVFALMPPGTSPAADSEFVATLQSPHAVFTVRFEDSTFCTVSCAEPERLLLVTNRFGAGPNHEEPSLLLRTWEQRELELYPAKFGKTDDQAHVPELSLFRDQLRFENPSPLWMRNSVQVFEPNDARASWLYVTSGMTNPWDEESQPSGACGFGYEFILETDARATWPIEVLHWIMAFNMIKSTGLYGGELLAEGSRIPLGNGIDHGSWSLIRNLLLTTPPTFHGSMTFAAGEMRFIQVIGVTDSEIDFARQQSNQALIEKLSLQPWWPLTLTHRGSVV